MQDIINHATSLVSGGSVEEPPRKKRRVETPPEEPQEEPVGTPDKVARSMLLRYHAQDPQLLKKICNDEYQRIQNLNEEEVQEELELIKMHHKTNLPGDSAHGMMGLLGFVLDRWMGLENTSKDLIEHPQLTALIEHTFPLQDHWSSIPMQICYILLDIVTKKIKR